LNSECICHQFDVHSHHLTHLFLKLLACPVRFKTNVLFFPNPLTMPQLFLPFVNGGLRLRRHSIGQSNFNDYIDVHEKRRHHYGSFGGLADSVHPLCFVLPDSVDSDPNSGQIPFRSNRLPPPPPPPPPASRNENLSNGGFGKTMTVIEVN
jgi:hypothetical protein